MVTDTEIIEHLHAPSFVDLVKIGFANTVGGLEAIQIETERVITSRNPSWFLFKTLLSLGFLSLESYRWLRD